MLTKAKLVIFPMVFVFVILACFSCNDPGMTGKIKPIIEMYFNNPGDDWHYGQDPLWDDRIAQYMDKAEYTIDACVMGFNRAVLYEAMIRAHHRGVKVRFAGDIAHWNDAGYKAFRNEKDFPIVVGNVAHIQHNKFFVVDKRIVYYGGANWTQSDFLNNNNDGMLVSSRKLAEVFTHEFEKMFNGAFTRTKPIDIGYDDKVENHLIYFVYEQADYNRTNDPDNTNDNIEGPLSYEEKVYGHPSGTNDTNPWLYLDPLSESVGLRRPVYVEVWFTPYSHENKKGNANAWKLAGSTNISPTKFANTNYYNGYFSHIGINSQKVDFLDVTGIIVNRLTRAKNTLDFTIFAYTRNEVGAAMVGCKDRGVKIRGIFDESQIYSTDFFTEVYRLGDAGGFEVNPFYDIRLDGNYHTGYPYEVSRGGGRYHTKTMIVDAYNADLDPMVMTGSFNWSISATRFNDETFTIIHSYSIAQQYTRKFERDFSNATAINPMDSTSGDVVITEFSFGGSLSNDGTSSIEDNFLELYNTTDRDVNISFWRFKIDEAHKFTMKCPSTINKNSYFLIPFRNYKAYRLVDAIGWQHDGSMIFMQEQQMMTIEYKLQFAEGNKKVELFDDRGNKLDQIGDGSTRFVDAWSGHNNGGKRRSIERIMNASMLTNGASLIATYPGSAYTNWSICGRTNGGENVHADYKLNTIATPRANNSMITN